MSRRSRMIASRGTRLRRRRGQRGVVMYVAIIVLIVMTLAGLALLRQMSASSAIAGNVAFKQGATSGADLGIELAHDWLVNPATGISLLADQTPATSTTVPLTGAYFASWVASETDPTSAIWATFWAAAPVNSDPVTHDQIRFVIHRLCTTRGAVGGANVCVASNGVSPSRGADTSSGSAPQPDPQPYYRVTAQVIGARNTVSYTQVLLGSR